MSEVIEIVKEPGLGGLLWNPSQGAEFLGLLARQAKLDQEQKDGLLHQSVQILGRCAPPFGQAAASTGLVFGYVQSGKTLSFISVTALARDNGYQMVIIVAGVSKNLLEQSENRLRRELNLPPHTDRNRKWRHFSNPRPEQRQEIAQTLADWDDPDLSDSSRRCVLITVMKESTHLGNLGKVLKDLSMEGRPVLIIDDEADQASMNANATKPAANPSTIYRQVVGLKTFVPHHTLLQYTATPQAPLLISLFDVLSPSFVRVLPPGKGYVGGKQFFALGSTAVVPITASTDLPVGNTPPEPVPESLVHSLRLFFIGVAIGWATDDTEGNRSMLVHPSQNTSLHETYHLWVQSIIKDWRRRLALSEADPDRHSLVDSLRTAYEEVAASAGGVPPFEDVFKKMDRALRTTVVTLVNAAKGATPSIAFGDSYSHIVVGGQSMDRGFTVEGLTVTYMPRALGVGNADTLQQRARFFGYKSKYFGLCRVFLSTDVRNSFVHYVESEEHVRKLLQEHQESGLSLKHWRRMFKLHASLKPTRRNVLQNGAKRYHFGGRWCADLSKSTGAAKANNQALVDNVRGLLDFSVWGGQSSSDRPHQVASTTMSEVMELLLTDFVTPDLVESEKFQALSTLIRDHTERLDEPCSVFLMNGLEPRKRTLVDGKIPDYGRLFQGHSATYVGDEKVRAQDGFTVQVHWIQDEADGQSFPLVAVYSPIAMASSLLVSEFEEWIEP